MCAWIRCCGGTKKDVDLFQTFYDNAGGYMIRPYDWSGGGYTFSNPTFVKSGNVTGISKTGFSGYIGTFASSVPIDVTNLSKIKVTMVMTQNTQAKTMVAVTPNLVDGYTQTSFTLVEGERNNVTVIAEINVSALTGNYYLVVSNYNGGYGFSVMCNDVKGER